MPVAAMKTSLFFLRQCFRVLLWSCGVIAVFYALPCWVLNWTGDRRWQRVATDLEAAGGTLDFLELLPPPVPEAKNFAAIEPLNGIRTAPGDSEVARAAQARRDEIEKACDFVKETQSKAGLPKNGECFTAARGINMEELALLYFDGGFLPWPEDTPADVQGLRLAIEKHTPFILELGRAACERPDAEFLPRLTEETLPEALLALSYKHVECSTSLTGVAALHGMTAIHSRDVAAVMQDLHLLHRLSRASVQEPSLITFLVSLGINQAALELVWHSLRDSLLNDSQLGEAQALLNTLDFSPQLLQASFAEIAMFSDTVVELEQNRDGIWGLYTDRPKPTDKALAALLPRGWIMHSKSHLVENELRWIIKPFQDGGIEALFCQHEAFKDWLISNAKWTWGKLDNFFTRLVFPMTVTIHLKAAHVENTRRQAVLACALERHRLRHQTYPAALADLEVGVYSMCLEGVDGKPVRYRLMEEGGYRLWSDGMDGRDDGGSFHLELHPGEKSPQPDDERYQGDWVWRYDAVK